MKKKKPRSGKTVKLAVRAVRRVTRRKPKAPRRKASPAGAKRAKSKSTKKRPTLAKSRTRTAAKTKRVTKRVYRKTRAKPTSIAGESEQLVPPVLADADQEPGVAPAEQAGISSAPAGEPPEEKGAQAELGLKIPQLLLEGDEPAPPISGPGQKYALGPTTPRGDVGHEEATLPEAYGTGKLLLAARDPHWLYAHWDLTPQQQRHYNALAADRHLLVRVYPGAIGTQPVREVHVHPESRHWFIHVDRAETQYVAELGYYRSGRQWVTVATSPPAVTPADTASTDPTVRFATIPAHVRLTQLAALAKQTVPADLPPLEAARERALAELVSLQLIRQDWVSSAGIEELVRRGGQQEISAAEVSLPTPLGGEGESVSSPIAAPEQRPAGFWFSVNAELVIYGATEPDATVTMGGQPIQLRPDGTFSCRLALPDGDHTVTLSAMSAQGELRQAELKFTRRTEHRGDVGVAPQSQPPAPPAPLFGPDPGL